MLLNIFLSLEIITDFIFCYPDVDHPTPRKSEIDETTPDDVPLNTPVEEEFVKQPVETTQPPVQDISEEQVETTPSPVFEPETERKIDSVVTTEPQVTENITISPPNAKVSEDGATDEAIDDRVKSDVVEDVDPRDSVVM